MIRLSIKQTEGLIEYFQDKLQDYLEVRKWLDQDVTREAVETILNSLE